MLIVYGDRWAAAGHADKPFDWAIEDRWQISRGLRPHPDNLMHGFGYKLSKLVHIGFHSGVERDKNVADAVTSCANILQKNPKDNIVIASWSPTQLAQTFELEKFIELLDMTDTTYCFVNSENTVPQMRGNWLWNTVQQSLRSWAAYHGHLSGENLTKEGHTQLANLLLLRLTKLMKNLIVRA